MFRYSTAGESHGKQLTVMVEGLPAGLPLSAADINEDLARRQAGFGRGARMKIEKDAVEFTAGVRLGETIGSPVCMVIKNFDWENWKHIMAADAAPASGRAAQVRPRPGHADLPAALKFDRHDLRDILERASARETAARVACGAACKKLLAAFDITVYSYTTMIGGIAADCSGLSNTVIAERAERSAVRTPDKAAEKKMIHLITQAESKGDTLGGMVAVVAHGVPVGLGSHVQWDQKLDSRIAAALMSIQAIKGVLFGMGIGFAIKKGSAAHDELFYDETAGFYRKTNHAGGIEGGISNGEDIVAHCVMKPIPSLKKPMRSVDMVTKKPDRAEAVRSDVCAVPAAGVIAEAVLAAELAAAMKEKFGGDSLGEMRRNYEAYRDQLRRF